MLLGAGQIDRIRLAAAITSWLSFYEIDVARGCGIEPMSPRSRLELADGSKRVTVAFRKKNKRWLAQEPLFRGIRFPRKLLRIRAF